MVSRSGTYSANVNKYHRSFPEDAAVFESLLPARHSSHCVNLISRISRLENHCRCDPQWEGNI